MIVWECVDKNNETFANRDSVGPLKGLRWGLTLPEDTASDQKGKVKARTKSKETGTETESEPECVTDLFLHSILIPKKALQRDKAVYK